MTQNILKPQGETFVRHAEMYIYIHWKSFVNVTAPVPIRFQQQTFTLCVLQKKVELS